jgi:hypothetical protein
MRWSKCNELSGVPKVFDRTPMPHKFTPRVPVRGGLSGGGTVHREGAKKRSSGDADLEDKDALEDSASSPEKKGDRLTREADENVLEPNARKVLDMNSTDVSTETNMETDGLAGENQMPPLPPPYVKMKDRAKARKTGTTGIDTENLASSAAPLEGDRRAQ